MEPIIQRDPINRRTFSMWDECGMRFRSNVVEPGGRIPLHVHSYSHVATVHGPFTMTVIDPQGQQSTRRVERGAVTILAGHQHSFDYLGDRDVGEVLCFWPVGHDGGLA